MDYDNASISTVRVELTHGVSRMSKKKAARPPAIGPGTFLDLCSLLLALDAYKTLIGTYPVELAADMQALERKGEVLLRRYLDELVTATKQVADPLVAREDASMLRTLYHQVENAPSNIVGVLHRYPPFLARLFGWMRVRQNVIRDQFSGRAYRVALELSAAVAEDSPQARLAALATVPIATGMTTPRTWIRQAAEAAGVPVDPSEALEADAESVTSAAEQLRDVQNQLRSAEPVSEEATVLQDQKHKLTQRVDALVATSVSPDTMRATALSTTSAPESRVSRKFGLTPEQDTVMRAMGKVVVAATAGSGKTQTLVAAIAHLVEEKGYNPGSIMTCSFTKAASAELAHRIETRAGIHGVDVGTTHHFAREIIKRNRPDLAHFVRGGGMASAKAAEKLFKIALVQITLSEDLYAKQLEENRGHIEAIESRRGWQYNNFLTSLHTQLSKGRNLSPKQLDALYGKGRTASGPEEASPEEGGSKMSPYWMKPVGEWFNIGCQGVIGEDGKPLGEKGAKLIVERFKTDLKSVADVRAEFGDNDPAVALYGAYEWLKRNDRVIGPAIDQTDQLVIAYQILEDNPRALAQEQARYKCLFIDEAQDLNELQFRTFQLLGEKSDLLMFVGDDSQSIYAFRGAKPQNYIDLTKTPGYQTLPMSMNFRSGKAIVDAAQKLITHNEDRRIPLMCQADEVRKGMGEIKARQAETHEEAASYVAEEIRTMLEDGGSASDFGILVRNNAEADAYTLELLVRGIPYRTLSRQEGGYFGKPLVRALLAWMRLIVGGTPAEINAAVLEAHTTPGFGLDAGFSANLAKYVRGETYLSYISRGEPVYDGQVAWLNKRVAEYVKAIQTLRVSGGMDSESIVRAILDIKGLKGTFVEVLASRVDDEDVIADTGADTEEARKEAALAPVRPIMIMARHFKDPVNLLAMVAKMKAANELVQKKTPDQPDDFKEAAVLVGSCHGWKGLQAKHVYVSMAGGAFPNYRSDNKAVAQRNAYWEGLASNITARPDWESDAFLVKALDVIQDNGELSEQDEAELVRRVGKSPAPKEVTAYDEERRLAYVALTRGEQTVTVMSPRRNYLGRPSGSSRFIGEACVAVVGAVEEKPELPDDFTQGPASAESVKTATTEVPSTRQAAYNSLLKVNVASQLHLFDLYDMVED